MTTLPYLRSLLPHGQDLPDEMWYSRHRAIVMLLWFHAVGIVIFGAYMGVELLHVAGEGSLIVIAALAASSQRLGRAPRSVIASLGLMSSSAILVHLSGGYVEMHFHFFIMVVVVGLYQSWTPFLVAVGYVVLHHGVVGVLDPRAVYNHPDAWANPWKWAGIHGLFISAACAATLTSWRLAENTYNRLTQERVAHAETEAAIHARDEAVATLVHDLGNPLTIIQGYVDLLAMPGPKGSTLTERADQLIEPLGTGVRQLGDLLDELRDAAVLRAGSTLELRRAPTDLTVLIGDLVRAQNEALGNTEMVFESQTKTLVGLWDRPRLARVVANLLSNAVKYSPNGGLITVSLSTDADAAIVSVQDQGIGIPAVDLPHVLKAYHRGRNTAGRIAGSGLGLAGANSIVEQHGGTLTISSQEGHGTLVALRLPYETVETPLIPEPESLSCQPLITSPSSVSL